MMRLLLVGVVLVGALTWLGVALICPPNHPPPPKPEPERAAQDPFRWHGRLSLTFEADGAPLTCTAAASAEQKPDSRLVLVQAQVGQLDCESPVLEELLRLRLLSADSFPVLSLELLHRPSDLEFHAMALGNRRSALQGVEDFEVTKNGDLVIELETRLAFFDIFDEWLGDIAIGNTLRLAARLKRADLEKTGKERSDEE